jgi:hypothetical protein
MSKKSKTPASFQPLTCIRQTGTRRESNGTICYTFVAEVNRTLPAVVLTLTVTPALVLATEARFDEQTRQEPDISPAEQATQPALLDVG